MAELKIKAELKRLANSPFVGNISKQVTLYEQRVKKMVSDFDSRSRDARVRSRHQLDKFADQLKKTRDDVEKRVTTLWNHEGQRLNKGVNELLAYLKLMTKGEKTGSRSKASTTGARASKKRNTTKRAGTTTTKKTRVRRSGATVSASPA